jgi:hypothetical protein
MKATTGLVSLLFAFSIAGAACSSGGSGVSSSKPVSEFDQGDVDKFCDYTDELFSEIEEDFVKVLCYALAAAFGDGEEECEMLAQECIEGEEEEEEEEEDQCELGDLPDCASEITAGELEDCLEAEADQISTFARTVNCASDFEQAFVDPPECQAIEAKCPGFFD